MQALKKGVFIGAMVLAQTLGVSQANEPVAFPFKSLNVYGVEIKIDVNQIDPESKRYLGTLNVKDRLKKVFPGFEKGNKLPSEVHQMIRKQTTDKAVAFDGMVLEMAKKEAEKINRVKKNTIAAEDIMLEMGEHIKDGNYRATRARFSSVSKEDFKQAYDAHMDFLLLMTLNDQIPQE